MPSATIKQRYGGLRRWVPVLLSKRNLLNAGAGVALLASTASLCAPPTKTSGNGELTNRTLLRFFGPNLQMRKGGEFGLDRAHLQRVSDQPFSAFLRVQYPKNSGSNRSAREDGTNAGGAQVYLLKSPPADHLYLRYRVRFPTGFDFVKGGKLPGLYGGSQTSGGKIPDGTDGFSTRYMWRRQGAGEVYAYLPTSKEHGTSLDRGSWTWPTGQWTCMEQEVRLNDPKQSNGTVRVWMDDKQVMQKDHLKYRTTSNLKIDGLFFSTFFGGGDSSWATPRSQYADFADFSLSARRVGCH